MPPLRGPHERILLTLSMAELDASFFSLLHYPPTADGQRFAKNLKFVAMNLDRETLEATSR